MTDFEKKLLKEEQENKPLSIDPETKYSDEFYETYIKSFKSREKINPFYLFTKRLFDLLASAIALLILLIPFLFIAIAIKLDSKGPVLFKNRRVGKNGKVFNCLKFRSMSVEAPPEEATNLIQHADSYITKVGHFLRKTSLDELPQLINVFTGKMSLVGYRPILVTEYNCNEMRNELGVLKMKPGITGYSQIHGRDLMYYKNKAVMDSYYVRNASIAFDFKLLFQTVMVVLKKDGNQDAEEVSR